MRRKHIHGDVGERCESMRCNTCLCGSSKWWCDAFSSSAHKAVHGAMPLGHVPGGPHSATKEACVVASLSNWTMMWCFGGAVSLPLLDCVVTSRESPCASGDVSPSSLAAAMGGGQGILCIRTYMGTQQCSNCAEQMGGETGKEVKRWLEERCEL